MIVVKVELWSAITGEKTEIARAVIDNVGGTTTRGNYRARSIRGRGAEDLHKNMLDVLRGNTPPVHQGEIKNHPRLTEHVWNLVAKALTSMGYGNGKKENQQ